MDVIIRLIIRIFEEVFSQDTERRRKEQQARQQQMMRRQQQLRQQLQQQQQPTQQQQHPQQGQPRPKSLLEELFRDLQELEGPPPPPPPPAQHRSMPQPGPHRQEHRHESMEEHIRRLERQQEHLVLETEQHLGVDLHGKTQKPKVLTLPGDTALQQMIYGQVILGPCKARRNQRSFF